MRPGRREGKEDKNEGFALILSLFPGVMTILASYGVGSCPRGLAREGRGRGDYREEKGSVEASGEGRVWSRI